MSRYSTPPFRLSPSWRSEALISPFPLRGKGGDGGGGLFRLSPFAFRLSTFDFRLSTCSGGGATPPAEPVDNGPAHHPLEVAGFQPSHLFGEHRHAYVNRLSAWRSPLKSKGESRKGIPTFAGCAITYYLLPMRYATEFKSKGESRKAKGAFPQ